MLEHARALRFAIETLQQIRVLSEAAGHHLDSDAALDQRIPALIDDAHAALAERFQDLVLADLFELGRGHTYCVTLSNWRPTITMLSTGTGALSRTLINVPLRLPTSSRKKSSPRT